MIRKEIIDTLRQTATAALFLPLIPIAWIVNQFRLADNPEFSHYLDSGLSMWFTMALLYLSWGVFSSEKKENALDYLKSLPIAGNRLLVAKVLPRLIVLAVIMFLLTVPEWSSFALYGFDLIPLTVLVVSGFLLGSTGSRNPILALLSVLPGVYWLFPGWHAAAQVYGWLMARYTGFGAEAMWSAAKLSVLIVPTILPVAVLLPLYARWQSMSGGELAQQMLKRLIAPTVLLIGIAVFAFS